MFKYHILKILNLDITKSTYYEKNTIIIDTNN